MKRVFQVLFKIATKDMSQPQHISLETQFSIIDCEKAFQQLDKTQSLYAYNFARASWNGAKICFFERSYQSPALLYILLKAFGKQSAREFFDRLKPELEKEELDKIYIYLSAFLDNCGNYKSFGDTKFVPECSQENFRKFWTKTDHWSKQSKQFEQIYSRIEKYLFTYQAPYGLIHFADKQGTTGYYSSNITSKDAEAIKQITIKKDLMSENNRLVKLGPNKFEIRVASIDIREQVIEQNGYHITVKYGEFSLFLRQTNKYLTEAQKYSANETQKQMIEEYIDHFKTGDMKRHKDSQKSWIKDKQPAIETNIGFIESYLDPLKVRAQFEGFVAVVNKEESDLLTKLVQNAENSLKLLPWGQKFEVKEFKKPDFTSLQVLAFGSSGIPVGINIPNYDDIRQNFGFKNVNLGNAYGEPTVKSIQYTPENEIEDHLKYYKPSLFVIVALHELLGHGSGRLIHQKPDFSNPVDNSEITTFYKPNETWHSVFGEIASTYEQCRADSVALYLSTFEDIQGILLPKYSSEERWQIVNIAWFDLIVSGLKGMQYFDPGSKKWLQPHIGAAYAIYKVLQEQGGVFEVKETQREGKEYLEIHLNRENIKTKGKDAIGRFLKHLQVYKSTADVKSGTAYFSKYLEMGEKELKYREVVMKNKRPRRLHVQAHLTVSNDKIEYVKYPGDVFGCIDSGIAHFEQDADEIIQQWEKNNQEFRY